MATYINPKIYQYGFESVGENGYKRPQATSISTESDATNDEKPFTLLWNTETSLSSGSSGTMYIDPSCTSLEVDASSTPVNTAPTYTAVVDSEDNLYFVPGVITDADSLSSSTTLYSTMYDALTADNGTTSTNDLSILSYGYEIASESDYADFTALMFALVLSNTSSVGATIETSSILAESAIMNYPLTEIVTNNLVTGFSVSNVGHSNTTTVNIDSTTTDTSVDKFALIAFHPAVTSYYVKSIIDSEGSETVYKTLPKAEGSASSFEVVLGGALSATQTLSEGNSFSFTKTKVNVTSN